MGQIYKSDFNVDNGTDFDKYNFSTSADQVSYTKNGKETNVQTELDALNTGMDLKSYTISLVSNNYVSEVGITAKKSDVLHVIGIQFRLIYNIPAWGGVKIARISDWNYPSDMIIPCISTMDVNAYAQGAVVQISTSGDIMIVSHGALTAGDWFYGNTVF